jgi:glycosyltransferase involved in cell wall biosynthesis
MGKIMPTVSVGVPVFNGEKTILRCLKGLHNQTLQPFEVIILDNCSSDRTADICLDFVKDHPNFRYSRNDNNIGGAENMNRALASATGDFFMWAAHDDFHDPAFINTCVNIMSSHPSAVLCNTGMNVCVDTTNDISFKITMKTFRSEMSRVNRFKEVFLRYPSPSFYGLYRTKVLRGMKPIQPTLGAELAWALELSLHGEFVSCDSFLFYYINSLTQKNDYESIGDVKTKVAARFLNYLTRYIRYFEIVSDSELRLREKVVLYLFLFGRAVIENTMRAFFTLLVSQPKGRARLAPFLAKRFLVNPNYLIDNLGKFEMREIPRILDRWKF